MSDEGDAYYSYRFGTAELNEATGELLVSGKPVRMQANSFKLLAYLLKRAGTMVTRQALEKAVWGTTVAPPYLLDAQLNKVRTALGEENAGYIETRPRRGYVLRGEVTATVLVVETPRSINVKAGAPVYKREQFLLTQRLGESQHIEVWLAHCAKTDEHRVYRFSKDAEGMTALQQEAQVSQALERLGQRSDLLRALDFNFEVAPYYSEYEYGGDNLVQWAATHLAAMPREERLNLFVRIAEPVIAALGIGVLHGDLKPSKILIRETPEGRLVRVRGFGTVIGPNDQTDVPNSPAKPSDIGSQRPEAGEMTPLYRAPECTAGGPVTTQGDVFSMGMLLYQLVTGDLHRRLDSGWKPEIADAELSLDIERATDRDPSSRFDNVVVLTDRVRTLEQRREQARRDAALARSRARQPFFIITISALIVGLIATWGVVLAARQQALLMSQLRAEATRQTQRADAVVRFLSENVLSSSDPFIGSVHQTRTIRQALDDASARIAGFPDPLTEAAIRMSLGTVYVRIAESDAAVTQWRRVVGLLESNTTADNSELIESRYWLATALALASQFPEARQALQTADEERRMHPQDRSLELLSHRGWGTYYLNLQQDDQCIPHFERAIVMLRELSPADVPTLDLSRIALGQCYTGASRFSDSEKLATSVINEVRRRRNASELTLALAQYVYGESLGYQGHYQPAETALDNAYRVVKEKLGAGNPRTMSVLNAQCNLYSMSNQIERAITCMQESYTETRLRLGDQHWTTWGILSNMGIEQFVIKHYAAAAESLTRAHDGLTQYLGQNKPLTLFSGYYLARTVLKQGDADHAAVLATALTPDGLAGAEPGAPWGKRLSLLHGLILAGQHRDSEALALLQPASQMTHADDPNDTIIEDAQEMLARLQMQGPAQKQHDRRRAAR